MSFTADIYKKILFDISAGTSQTSPFAMRLVKLDNGIMIVFAVNLATRMRSAFLSVKSEAAKNMFPHWKGVDIEIVKLPAYEIDTPFVGLSQLPNSDSDIFEIVVEDLRSQLDVAENTDEALSVIISVLKKWKDFFAADKEILMSEKRQQGLFGELLFLSECLESHGSEAVSHWAGSEDETHDFYFGPHAIEVKTTSAQAPYCFPNRTCYGRAPTPFRGSRRDGQRHVSRSWPNRMRRPVHGRYRGRVSLFGKQSYRRPRRVPRRSEP